MHDQKELSECRSGRILCKFPDGTRAVFDAEHIRAIDTRTATEADFELYD